ncbi:Kinase-like protein [Mycena chlorophos]|uniref:Kinase-like protein n=1 Tax=Mycena chlorophos TaxID=658473 RepID=A0A8H6VTK4_MYCCL|nr:Kinase-like protein [Mycena chlorophos]
MPAKIRIATLFTKGKPRSSSSSRSPLSPIPLPNEHASTSTGGGSTVTSSGTGTGKRSIREPTSAGPRRHRSNTSDDSSSSGSPLLIFRRREMKTSDPSQSQPERLLVDSGEVEMEPRAIQFDWVRGDRLLKRDDLHLALVVATGEHLVAKRYTLDASETCGRPSPRSLKREVALMQEVEHPNVVRCMGFEQVGDSGEQVIVFSEYVPGTSLRSEIHKHGPMAENAVRSTVAALLNGLGHLHSLGIVHGALKSSKILVDRDSGVCKIAGLGCSTAPDRLRDHSRAVPRAIWCTAPEVVRTQWREWGCAADIWSLGCLVLEMLSGRRAWYDCEAVAVMFKLYHQSSRPAVPPDVVLTPAAADFLDKCLALQPHDRMCAAELRQHPFIAG